MLDVGKPNWSETQFVKIIKIYVDNHHNNYYLDLKRSKPKLNRKPNPYVCDICMCYV